MGFFGGYRTLRKRKKYIKFAKEPNGGMFELENQSLNEPPKKRNLQTYRRRKRKSAEKQN